jgi:NTE family protein
LLFDIVAGTSIGAMNGTVLVSQFLQAKKEQLEMRERKDRGRECWKKAVEQLEAFWNNVDKGLASIPEVIEKLPGWDKWQEVSNTNIPEVASKEAARRFYSVKYFFIFGALKMYVPLLCRPDFKFL